MTCSPRADSAGWWTSVHKNDTVWHFHGEGCCGRVQCRPVAFRWCWLAWLQSLSPFWSEQLKIKQCLFDLSGPKTIYLDLSSACAMHVAWDDLGWSNLATWSDCILAKNKVNICVHATADAEASSNPLEISLCQSRQVHCSSSAALLADFTAHASGHNWNHPKLKSLLVCRVWKTMS